MDMEKSGLILKRGTLLKFVDEEKGETTEGLFIGPEDNSDFVVVPLSEKKPKKIKGDILHGQCRFQDDLYAFQSKILEVIDYPVTLWRINGPADVEKYDLRHQKRIQCSVSASIEAIHKGQFVTGIIQDISKSGARFIFKLTDATENPFGADDHVRIRCTFPGIPGEQSAPGKVTDVLKTEKELSIGIQFTDSVWWVPPYH